MNTIEDTIPLEIDYLEKYDRMKDYLDNHFEMPDKTVDMLIRFLKQGNGQVSEGVIAEEFMELTYEEILSIQDKYVHVFL